ncbi:MAG: TlpA family protein disulfide reductase [Bradyrhizobiaceae bacterium]|nr:TlpA family protein disulfide reductase [Bradyrhizobiaceae bacterium]
MTDQPQQAGSRKGPLAVAAVVAGLGILAAVYGVVGASRNVGDSACRGALDAANRVEPFARGEVAAVRPAEEARKLPDLAFSGAAGEPKTLADWHGRTVLLNLWATWCIPCRKEMPALDALQAKLGGPDFEVVAVNIDTRNLDKPKSFLQEVGVNHLAYFSDASAKVFQDLKAVGKAFGMPTSLLVAPDGCEIASLAGPAEWASEDGVKLVNAALGREKTP